jgi:pimeloyl-ACP methyl ester carboxylesterase
VVGVGAGHDCAIARPGEEEIVMNARSASANVVLVHGGFADGSGWRGVYDLLTQDGYHVAVVQTRPCRWPVTPPRRD